MFLILLGMQPIARAQDTSPLAVIQSAVDKSAEQLKSTVVQVKLEGYASRSQSYTIVGGQLRANTSSGNLVTLNGTVVSNAGHVVVMGQFPADKVEQVEILIGNLEVPGKIVGKDNLLNMTLIEIDPHPALKSVLALEEGRLKGGDFTVLLEAGRENWDYQPMLSLSMCRGEIPGNYTKYLLDQTSSRFKGSPVVSLDSKFAGFCLGGGEVLAISDIREDLEELINKGIKGDMSPDDEKKNKGWLGATISSINEDFARMKSIPQHAVLASYIVPDSPAKKSGMKTGDLIVGVQGKPLRFSGIRSKNLFFHLLRPRRDKPFEVTVLRDGKEVALKGKFAKWPEPDTLQADDLGITVSDIAAQDLVLLNLHEMNGVRVTQVQKGSPAAVSGSMRRTLLSTNDVITSLGEMPTPNVKAFNNALRKIRQRGDKVLLVEYRRGRSAGFAGLNLGLGENAK